MMSLKGLGRQWLWPIISTIPEFEWMHEGNHKHAVTIASVPAEVRTQYFQDKNRDLYIYINGAKTILRNQQFFSNSRNFQDLTEHERSFPCSQKPATVLHPQPDESDPRPQILFIEIYFQYYLLIYVWVFLVVSLLQV